MHIRDWNVYWKVYGITCVFCAKFQNDWSNMTSSANEMSRDFRLTHWGRVTHICVGNLTIIDPDNGLSPGRRQAIIWTNAGIVLIGPWRTNFSEILIGIQTFSFKKMHLKMSSAKCHPFCLGLYVLRRVSRGSYIATVTLDTRLCFVSDEGLTAVIGRCNWSNSLQWIHLLK